MKISVRMEGGIGDHLAANRFIPAIKEVNPGCTIDLYSDTEGSELQSNLLKNLWPSHFDNIHVIQTKKHKKLIAASTIKGNPNKKLKEEQPGILQNVPDEILNKMTNQYDKFYDLHIDSLNWLDQDFPWFKYFQFFPRPESLPKPDINLPNEFILGYFFARDGAPSNMEDWYIDQIINKISKQFPLVVLYNQDSEPAYRKLMEKGVDNCTFINASLEEIFYISSKCLAAFGIDSGVRFIPYHFGKPTFTFCEYCSQYGSVPYSYIIRWLYNEKFVFPLHFDMRTVITIVKNIISNKAYMLFPHILSDIGKYAVQREISKVTIG